MTNQERPRISAGPRGCEGGLKSMRHPSAEPHEAREDLAAEVWQLVEIVDEGKRDAAHAGFADGRELIGHAVRRSDEGVAADRLFCKVLAFLEVVLGRDRPRRDVLVREHAVDRTPIGVLDDGVAVVVLRLLLAWPTDHLPDREDLDVATKTLRRAPDLGDLLRIALERGSRARGGHEERIAVAQRKGLADLRGAGIHDDRPRLAVGLGVGAHALEVEEPSVEIEIAAFQPGSLDDIEPFL